MATSHCVCPQCATTHQQPPPPSQSLGCHPPQYYSLNDSSKQTEINEADSLSKKRSENESGTAVSSSGGRRTSVGSANSHTSNSKAVLAALKALQEKIRKLESEKEFFSETVESTKRRLLEQQSDFEKTLSEERAKCKETENTLRRERDVILHEKALVIAEKQEMVVSLNASNERYTSLQNEMQYLKQLLDTKDSEKQQMQQRIDELSKALHKEKKQREHLEDHKTRMDQAMREMININHTLIEKINQSASTATNTNAASQQQYTYTPLERPLSRGRSTTPPSRAAPVVIPSVDDSAAAKTVKKKKKTITTSATTRRRTPSPMRASAFSSASNGRSTSVPRQRKCQTASESRSIHARLKKAVQKDPVPFLLGKSKTTFNVTGNAQQMISQSLNTGTKKTLLEGHFHEDKNASADDVSPLVDFEDIDPDMDIDAVLAQLEDEHESLHADYHNLLTRAHENPDEGFNISTALKQLLDSMERKSKQMEVLRNYKEMMIEALREATSPPRVRGAVKRMKTMRLLRDLRAANSCK